VAERAVLDGSAGPHHGLAKIDAAAAALGDGATILIVIALAALHGTAADQSFQLVAGEVAAAIVLTPCVTANLAALGRIHAS
jgi:hypothetical protein